MKTNKRGLTTVGTVVAIVVGVLVIGAAAYFISDPFRSKVKEGYDQFSKWTPENIVKNPTGYLNFCEEQTNNAIMKCKASKLAIAQKQGELEKLGQDNEDKVKVGQKALDELKDAYRKADTDKKWPLTWREKTLDQDQTKKQIVRLANEIEGKTTLVKRYKDGCAMLRVQAGKVDDAFDKANEQLGKIKVNRETLKVQQITDDLKNNLVAMGAVIQTTIGTVGSETGTLSLDDLASKSETTVDSSKFDDIMKKK